MTDTERGQQILESLVDSLSLSNHPWNAWELEFIEDLEGRKFEHLSQLQQKKVEELWEKL